MIDVFRWFGPVDQTIFFLDFFTVGGSLVILGKWGDPTSLEFAKCLYECRTRYVREFLEKRPSSLSIFDGDRAYLQYISLIHTLTHPHYSDTCFTLSMEERSLYRRSTSIGRKEGTMDINTHFFWYFEEVERENLPIGDDDKIFTCETSHYIEKFSISSYFFWGITRDVML